MKDQQLIREMVEAIVPISRPDQVVLFGSRARGEARVDSDVDLLVVVPRGFGAGRSRRQELSLLWRALARFPVPKDILLYSRDEVLKWGASINHVVARALREGAVVYERG
jgi:predicted nucleotidyltransferase